MNWESKFSSRHYTQTFCISSVRFCDTRLDLDRDLMTLIREVEFRRCSRIAEVNCLDQGLSTNRRDTQTDATECITTPHLQVVITSRWAEIVCVFVFRLQFMEWLRAFQIGRSYRRSQEDSLTGITAPRTLKLENNTPLFYRLKQQQLIGLISTIFSN